jgi:hypothetical protein
LKKSLKISNILRANLPNHLPIANKMNDLQRCSTSAKEEKMRFFPLTAPPGINNLRQAPSPNRPQKTLYVQFCRNHVYLYANIFSQKNHRHSHPELTADSRKAGSRPPNQ